MRLYEELNKVALELPEGADLEVTLVESELLITFSLKSTGVKPGSSEWMSILSDARKSVKNGTAQFHGHKIVVKQQETLRGKNN